MKIINICTTLLRLIITIILLILILSSSVVADTNSGNDSQTHQEYVKIWAAEDLNNIRNNYNQSYTLMNDIDLSIYSNWYPIETFNGIFDGNGYTISNLSINRDLKTIGLFGINNGEIKNLVLENPKIVKVVGVDTSTSYVGTIAGKNEGIISNVYVKGHTEVSSPRGYVGGLTGEMRVMLLIVRSI